MCCIVLLNRIDQNIEEEKNIKFMVGHVSEDSTGSAALRGLACCVEMSAVLSSATWPGAAIQTLYLILNIKKCSF